MRSTKLRAAVVVVVVVVVVALALAGFLGCSASDVSLPSQAAPPRTRTFAVAHTSAALGVPSFVWLGRSDWPAFDDAHVAAREVLRAVAPTLRLREAGLATLGTAVVHDTGRGPIVARYAQRLDGVEVFRGGLNLVLSRTFAPVAATGLVAAELGHDAGFAKDALAALDIAHRTLTGQSATFTPLDTQGDYQRFTSSVTRSTHPARAKRVYFPTKTGLEPAWFVELLLATGVSHAYVVSASTGRVLFSNDLVRHDAYTYRVWASPDTKMPMDGPQGNAASPLVTPTPSGFKPTFVPAELVTLQSFPFSKNDPWLPPASTTTVGNNVRAYSDVARGDGFTASTADTYATTTADATFDYPYETSTTSAGSTPTAVKAAVTQMFYETNFLHDWYYDFGFDEKAGNHQQDNFGRGGAGGDALHAETQDFSGRNNANAATPADGASPVIQMYLFGGSAKASLEVAAPAPNAGLKTVGSAGQFGKDSFDLTAPVVVTVDGGGADPDDACENIGISLAGKIALAHRGNCAFVVKAQKAQAAGAVGIIIVNVASSAQPTVAPFMGGTALDVTIPALSLSLADGQALEAAAGAVVTMKREPTRDLDGALDSQIVAHEWGHVLSNRLIADGSGLDTNQAGGLGEGWGDFSAMMLGVREDDALVAANAGWAGVYPSASYATSGDSDFYYGIRRVPYSTDLKKDPLTFKHIADGTPLPTDVPISFGEDGSSNSEVHNTGEVWATMLWECYASLLASGRLGFKEAQERMKTYFVASLKLTPPSPTLLEARDAVLAAASAGDPRDLELFWKAFAKRGAGVGATGPKSDSSNNKGVKESFVVGNAVALVSLSVKDDVISCDHDGIIDEGEVGTVEVTIRNAGAGTLMKTTATLTSRSSKVTFFDQGRVAFEPLQPFETKVASVKAYVDGLADDEPVTIDIVVDDPTVVSGGSLTLALPTPHGVDEVADSSLLDTVETKGTSWKVTGTDQTGTSTTWSRIQTGMNHSWFIPNAGEPADHQLTSPAFDVVDRSFSLSWKHRWSFESSVPDKKDFDGGVVELTLDNGKTWNDISTYGAIDYNVTLEDDPRTTMVLKGRKAYGHDSPGYPDKWVSSKVDVVLPSAQATVRVRFRHGSDDNSASVGWEIDDIAVTDLTNTPFYSFVPQRDECDPDGPTAVAPPGQTVTPGSLVSLVGSGTHPRSLPLQFSWRQEAGPVVFLRGRESANLSFDAPPGNAPVTLTFALRANDGALLSAPAKVDILVTPASPAALDAGGGCGCRVGGLPSDTTRVVGVAGLAGVALVLVRRRRKR